MLSDRERKLLDKINKLLAEFKQAQEEQKLPSFVGCRVDFQRHNKAISGDVYSWNPSSEFGFTLYEPDERAEFLRLHSIYGANL